LRRHAADTYRTFWDHVGAEFPDLGGAASTTFYFENEKRLLSRHLGTLAGKRVLKTDLWDEARNTRILQWVQRQGAKVVGVDISPSVVRMAGAAFTDAALMAVNADVRALPFADASFHAIYSMGTIEHFPETEAAVHELYRVLKPGGRAIVGVPNRHDPFLRPLMVTILYRLGLYGYGYEKSYSRKALRQMLEAAGFVITGDEAILFMPGWLRMLDLLCYTRYPAAARLTAAGTRVFAWIDAHVPAVRRHGYLVAAIGERPAETTHNAVTDAPTG
jgi:SAM-dependent methyltransferase